MISAVTCAIQCVHGGGEGGGISNASKHGDFRTVDGFSADIYKAFDNLPSEMISRMGALQIAVLVEMFNTRGSYISIPSVGTRNTY